MYHGVYESAKPQALSNTLADLCVSPAFMLELCDNSDKSDKKYIITIVMIFSVLRSVSTRVVEKRELKLYLEHGEMYLGGFIYE